jgi:cbb3-type cytochrome oxidase cytochrome c subunit
MKNTKIESINKKQKTLKISNILILSIGSIMTIVGVFISANINVEGEV